jgi:hypothetical protein
MYYKNEKGIFQRNILIDGKNAFSSVLFWVEFLQLAYPMSKEFHKILKSFLYFESEFSVSVTVEYLVCVDIATLRANICMFRL